jgi:hypothetical protein
MYRSRVLAILAVALSISACQGFEAVKPEKPITIANRIAVAPQVMWAKPTGSGISDAVWTIDGFGLNELHFMLNKKPGDALFNVRGDEKKDFPVMKKDMLPNDAMDLVVNSMTHLKNNQVRASNLAPAAFGAPNAGFRFDLNYVNADGLEMRGMALGSQHGDRLDMLLFIAPNEYYFGKLQDTVDRLFQSVQPIAGS